MKELSYYHSLADPLVRSRKIGDEHTITSTYTDDVTGVSSSVNGATTAKEELGRKYKTKDLGEAGLVLGIRIDRDRDKGTISISQRAYLERVLTRYGMEDCSAKSTPLPLGTKLSKSQAPSTDDDHHYMRDKPYSEALGSIMYAQIATRPDLSYAVSTLSKFSSNPGKAHWQAILHVLQYIKGTLQYKLTYGGEGYQSLVPHGYVDADYGNDVDTRRSCSGQIFLQAGGPTSWGSKYQPTVALSTTEAEYMALTRGAQQVLWMHSAMSEVGFPQPKPAVLYGDNTGAVCLTENTKHNARVKHIDIRHHYIRERVKEGDIHVNHIPSKDNLADLLTKPLSKHDHLRLCKLLRLYEE